jgi:hypothetical protein
MTVKDYPQSVLELYRSLGHPSLAYLKRACPDITITNVDCLVCDTTKMHQQPFLGSFPAASKPLEISNMDLCGPMMPALRGGNLYFLKIINGFSKYWFGSG